MVETVKKLGPSPVKRMMRRNTNQEQTGAMQ
jgi:hypothetical protein